MKEIYVVASTDNRGKSKTYCGKGCQKGLGHCN